MGKPWDNHGKTLIYTVNLKWKENLFAFVDWQVNGPSLYGERLLKMIAKNVTWTRLLTMVVELRGRMGKKKMWGQQ